MNAAHIEGRSVNAGDGWKWITQGFALFKSNPGMWIVLFIIYLIIGVILSKVPMIGPIILNILAPVFVAGFMSGCRDMEKGEDLEINHLFYGFKHHTSQLITVGGLYFTGIIIIVGIMFAGVDHATLQALLDGQKLSEQQAEVMLQNGFLLYMLVGAALLMPLMMAYWFAPLLVAFHGLKPVEAFKVSFKASLRNIMPFFVYSLIAMVLLIVAAIPFGLGMLVMIPTMMASLYTSYKDIFPMPEIVEEPEEI